MLLGKVEVLFTEALGVQAGVHVTFESQQSLPGILGGKRRVPVLEALGVQLPKLVADAHQIADLVRLQRFKLVDQLAGILKEFRLSIGTGRQRTLVIQRFGRGNNHQHVRQSSLQECK